MFVSAVYSDCDTDVKISKQEDTQPLESCQTYKGTITVEDVEASSLVFKGLIDVQGSVIINGNQNLEEIVFEDLKNISELFLVSGNEKLTQAKLPKLSTVSTLNFTNCASLSKIEVAPLEQIGNLTLCQTSLTQVPEIKTSSVGSIEIADNKDLQDVKIDNIISVLNTIKVSGNHKDAKLEMKDIKSVVGDCVLSDLTQVEIGTITTIGNMLSVENCTFSSIKLDSLQQAEHINLSMNPNLQNISFPELLKVAGNFSICDNPVLEEIDSSSLPGLTEVLGNFNISGQLSSLKFPSLQNFGDMNLASPKLPCDSIKQSYNNTEAKSISCTNEYSTSFNSTDNGNKQDENSDKKSSAVSLFRMALGFNGETMFFISLAVAFFSMLT